MKLESGLGALLLCASFALAAVFVGVAAHRQLTQLEVAFWQVLSLAVGLAGSFLFGRRSAHAAAREMIKPHARSAFRRLMSLYRGLSRLAAMMDSARTDRNPESSASSVLDKLEAVVVEQIQTADDAMEDWRDIDPEDVEELRRRVRDAKGREG